MAGWRRQLVKDVQFMEPDIDPRMQDSGDVRRAQMDIMTKPTFQPVKAEKRGQLCFCYIEGVSNEQYSTAVLLP